MNENIKISKDAIYATGKKERVDSKSMDSKGDGKITINGKKYNEYFKRPVHQLVIEKPFDITKTKNNYDIFATVKWWWYERSSRSNYTWYFKSFGWY